MKKKKITALLLAVMLMASACSNTSTVETALETAGETAETAQTEETADETVYEADIADYTGMTADEIVASLTLEQKAAQMVQGALYNVDYDDMEEYGYGSVLSHYGMFPELSVSEWRSITDDYQDPDALRQRQCARRQLH